MFVRVFSSILLICFISGSALGNTSIEYTLGGDWIYEEEHPGTLLLSDNPSGGINSAINVPSGIKWGGLTASRHDLPGFSIDNNIFIELEYGSLTYTITDLPPPLDVNLDLVLEVEFFDSNFKRYEIAMNLGYTYNRWNFDAWLHDDDETIDYQYREPIPDGLLIDEGALGLYFHGNKVSAYFKDVENNFLYPFLDFDISMIIGIHGFKVDNDFEANTEDGGAVLASINLKQVVYGPGFVDVPPGHWAAKYIYKIFDAGITKGCSQNPLKYCPYDPVTRAQMAAFIVRAAEGEPPANYCATGSPFTDVSSNTWPCKYIKRLLELEITTGCGPGIYCPNDLVTRAQMAAFLIRAVEGEPPEDYCDTGSPFTDVAPDTWPCKYIKRLSELGITKGCGGTKYCPDRNVTRAEMAAFLARAFLEME